MVWAIVETVLIAAAFLVTFLSGYTLGHRAGWDDYYKETRNRVAVYIRTRKCD